jgi:hypothetical protein
MRLKSNGIPKDGHMDALKDEVRFLLRSQKWGGYHLPWKTQRESDFFF